MSNQFPYGKGPAWSAMPSTFPVNTARPSQTGQNALQSSTKGPLFNASQMPGTGPFQIQGSIDSTLPSSNSTGQPSYSFIQSTSTYGNQSFPSYGGQNICSHGGQGIGPYGGQASFSGLNMISHDAQGMLTQGSQKQNSLEGQALSQYSGQKMPLLGDHNKPFHSDIKGPFHGGQNMPLHCSNNNFFQDNKNKPFQGGHNTPFQGGHKTPFQGGHNTPFQGGHKTPINGCQNDPKGSPYYGHNMTSHISQNQNPPTNQISYGFKNQQKFGFVNGKPESKMHFSQQTKGMNPDESKLTSQQIKLKKDIVKFLQNKKIKKPQFWNKFRAWSKGFPPKNIFGPVSKWKSIFQHLTDVIEINNNRVMLKSNVVCPSHTLHLPSNQIDSSQDVQPTAKPIQTATPLVPSITKLKDANEANGAKKNINFGAIKKERAIFENDLKKLLATCPNKKIMKNVIWGKYKYFFGKDVENLKLNVNTISEALKFLKKSITTDCSAHQIYARSIFLKLRTQNLIELDTYHPQDQLLKYRLLSVLIYHGGKCKFLKFYDSYYEFYGRYPYMPGVLRYIIQEHFSKEMYINQYDQLFLTESFSEHVPEISELLKVRSPDAKIGHNKDGQLNSSTGPCVNIKALERDVVLVLSVLKGRGIDKGRFFYQFRKYTDNVSRRKFSTQKYGLDLECTELEVLYKFMSNVIEIKKEKNLFFVKLQNTEYVENMIEDIFKCNLMEVLIYCGGKSKLKPLLTLYASFYGKLPYTIKESQEMVRTKFTDVMKVTGGKEDEERKDEANDQTDSNKKKNRQFCPIVTLTYQYDSSRYWAPIINKEAINNIHTSEHKEIQSSKNKSHFNNSASNDFDCHDIEKDYEEGDCKEKFIFKTENYSYDDPDFDEEISNYNNEEAIPESDTENYLYDDQDFDEEISDCNYEEAILESEKKAVNNEEQAHLNLKSVTESQQCSIHSVKPSNCHSREQSSKCESIKTSEHSEQLSSKSRERSTIHFEQRRSSSRSSSVHLRDNKRNFSPNVAPNRSNNSHSGRRSDSRESMNQKHRNNDEESYQPLNKGNRSIRENDLDYLQSKNRQERHVNRKPNGGSDKLNNEKKTLEEIRKEIEFERMKTQQLKLETKRLKMQVDKESKIREGSLDDRQSWRKRKFENDLISRDFSSPKKRQASNEKHYLKRPNVQSSRKSEERDTRTRVESYSSYNETKYRDSYREERVSGYESRTYSSYNEAKYRDSYREERVSDYETRTYSSYKETKYRDSHREERVSDYDTRTVEWDDLGSNKSSSRPIRKEIYNENEVGEKYVTPIRQQHVIVTKPSISGNYIIRQGTMAYTETGQPVIIPHSTIQGQPVMQTLSFKPREHHSSRY